MIYSPIHHSHHSTFLCFLGCDISINPLFISFRTHHCLYRLSSVIPIIDSVTSRNYSFSRLKYIQHSIIHTTVFLGCATFSIIIHTSMLLFLCYILNPSFTQLWTSLCYKEQSITYTTELVQHFYLPGEFASAQERCLT